MSDGHAEFLAFLQVGTALGVLCFALVLISHLVDRAGGRDGRSALARTSPAVGDVLAPEPIEGWRIRIANLADTQAVALPEIQRLERDSGDPEMRRVAADLEQAIA